MMTNNAELLRLKRLRLWLESGPDDAARSDYWRRVVASRRTDVDRIVTDSLRRICASREHAATITRILETLGDPVPDTARRTELDAKAEQRRHLLPAQLVADIMGALQDSVDAAEPGAYLELGQSPLKPTLGDPTTLAELDAARDALLREEG